LKATIVFAKVSEGATIPSKREEDAGLDIYACVDERNPNGWQIQPHTTELIPTGLIYACDKKWALVARERGSTGVVSLKIGAGVCDSGFRNEVFIALYNGLDKPIVIAQIYDKVNDAPEAVYYPASKAIAQFLVVPIPKVTIVEQSPDFVRAISSDRGLGQLGSSGK